MCRGEFYAVISQLISKCLWSNEAEGSGSVELKKCTPPHLQSCDSWIVVKENSDGKKSKKAKNGSILTIAIN